MRSVSGNRESGWRSGVGRRWSLGVRAGALAVGLVAVVLVVGCGGGEDEGGGGAVADDAGRVLFASHCGSCHTLADAETSGKVGPDLDELGLDELGLDEAQVLYAIENGGRETGAMPPGLLRGTDAELVAEYVSSVAGN